MNRYYTWKGVIVNRSDAAFSEQENAPCSSSGAGFFALMLFHHAS
jgi:hypothetical protein